MASGSAILSRRGVLLCAAAALTVALIATLITVLRPSRHKPTCQISGSGAPNCGAWWGAALDSTQQTLPVKVRSFEKSTGRRLDIVHTYHRWYESFPTQSEKSLAAQGHLMFFNWEPVDSAGHYLSWQRIAAGSEDATIDAEAARLKSLGVDVLVSFSHEPEKNFRQHGSAADFAAAFRHVVDRVRAAGGTDVRWVWNVMGLTNQVWLDRYRTMWPGDSYVDWVAWDPYNWSSCRKRAWQDFTGTVRPFYDWLQANGFGSKPFMLAEYGTVERPGNPSGKSDWYAGIPNALKQLPQLRALVYFNLPAPPANCDWLITTSRRARTGFGTLAGSEPFQWTAGQNPERRD
jgi:hypothetical protein